MAAPLAAAAKLLIKPIVAELKKEAIRRAAQSGAAKAAGLSIRDIEKLSNLDVLNLVRAKAVKGIKKDVAQSLGVSVKDLNATLKDITLTEQRKQAVKGLNYVKNANRFINNPVKTIKGQGKRIISEQIRKDARDTIKEQNPKPKVDKPEVKQDDKPEVKRDKTPQEEALDELQKTLDQYGYNNLKLPDYLWDIADELETRWIYAALDSIEDDRYYNIDNDTITVVSEKNQGRGGGYKLGYTSEDYIDHMVQLITSGRVVTKYEGGIIG